MVAGLNPIAKQELGFDIYKWNYRAIRQGLESGVIAAPPCTDFAVSGAQYWKKKDKDGTTEVKTTSSKTLTKLQLAA